MNMSRKPPGEIAKARAQDMQREFGRMNQWESDYADNLDAMRMAGEIQGWRFEPFKLRLGKDWKTTYAPDFQVIMADGTIELHEVKGFWRDDARVKIKVAAQQFPEYRFVAITRIKGGVWQMEEF